jgi:hypothetical protein
MTSALTRLRELPEAFTFAGFCKLNRFSNNAASVCLRRWKEKGLIEPAGERAKIYFNKLRSRQIDSALRVAALLFEYPSAILCGESVLHAAGWITQIPAQLSVAVLSRPSYVSLHGFDIRGRPITWFRKIHPLLEPTTEKRVYGLRALPPPLPLARLYISLRIYSPGELQSPHSTVDPKGNPMSTTTSAAPTPRVETFDEGLTVTFTDRGTGPFALRAHRELRPHATVRTAGAAAGAGARIRRDLGSLSRSGNIS